MQPATTPQPPGSVSEKELADFLINGRVRMIVFAVKKFRLSQTDAEDLVSDMHVKALRNREKYNSNSGKLSTWIFKMLVNMNIDRARSAHHKLQKNILSNEVHYNEDGFFLNDGKVEPEQLETSMLKEAVELLPEHQRYLMRGLLVGKSYSEMADELQKPLGTIKGHIKAARLILVNSLVSAGLLEPGQFGKYNYMLSSQTKCNPKVREMAATLMQQSSDLVIGIERKDVLPEPPKCQPVLSNSFIRIS